MDRQLKQSLHFTWDTASWALENDFARVALIDLGPQDDSEHPVAMLVDYHPGVVIPAHFHNCDYFSLVVSGEIEVTRQTHRAGDFRFVRAGTAYGPLRVGDEGCRVVEFFGDVNGTFPQYLKVTEEQRADLKRAEAMGRAFLRDRSRSSAAERPAVAIEGGTDISKEA